MISAPAWGGAKITTNDMGKTRQILVISLIHVSCFVAFGEFDHEIGKRVYERLSDFMETPSSLLRQLSNYRSNLAFPHDLRAPDRDAFLRFNKALMETYPESDRIYYGLEDGLFVGHLLGHGTKAWTSNYREPGESGYLVGEGAGDMQKHYMTCVNRTGGRIPCLMQTGDSFVECRDGCSLQKCPDEDSQRDCSLLEGDIEPLACAARTKWCVSYDIKEVPPSEGEGAQKYGYVPLSLCCTDSNGILSQKPGSIPQKGSHGDSNRDSISHFDGNCYFEDGVTPVERSLTGNYEYCGGEGIVCNDTFAGCFASLNYDPRYRPWYTATKMKQSPNWSPPYHFYGSTDMGITFSAPIYDLRHHNKRVFAGVLAVDYFLGNITSFLTQNYNPTNKIVAIFEQAPPNHVIATSTGSPTSKQVLSKDRTQPCVDPAADDCVPVQLMAEELSFNSQDRILSEAFARQAQAGFPEEELVTVNTKQNGLYVSQIVSFSIPSELLYWKIIIVIPLQTETQDVVRPGSDVFLVLVAASATGFFVCFLLFVLFVHYRHREEIMYCDWRFTSIFLLNCALLNASSLSMIGPNSDGLCIVRMWLFHFFFVCALSPLLVKVYRMYRLVGSSIIERKIISHTKTVLLALPFVVVQVVILIIFSLVDPNQQVEIVTPAGSDVTHRYVCAHGSQAFFAVQLVYEGGLVLVGCFLAFKTRNLKKEFGEAKQLVVAMYSIALAGSIVLVASKVAEVSEGTQKMFVAIGVSSATCISGLAFVIPRLILIRSRTNREKRGQIESDGFITDVGLGEDETLNHEAPVTFACQSLYVGTIANEEESTDSNPSDGENPYQGFAVFSWLFSK